LLSLFSLSLSPSLFCSFVPVSEPVHREAQQRSDGPEKRKEEIPREAKERKKRDDCGRHNRQ
jgi:hypothetical protein